MNESTQASGSGPRKLKRDLGLIHVTASGVSIIIGAGIFVLIAPASELAGGQVWLSFLVAAILCTFTALSYAELASMFPRAGGEFEFSKAVFPPWLTFLTFWLNLSSLIIAAATVSLGFAGYADKFVNLDHRISASALIGVTTVLALSGIKWSGRVVIVTASIEVFALTLVITFGLTRDSTHSILQGNGLSGILAGSALVFFAYIGFDEVTTLSEETRNPTKTIPHALLLALAITTVIYVLVSVSAVRLRGAGALANSTQPLADVMTGLWGSRGSLILAATALFTTFGTTLLAIQAGSRVLYGWATNILGTNRWKSVSLRGIPWVATLTVSSTTLVFSLTGKISTVAGLTDFAVFIVFLVVNSAAIALRIKKPETPRPFRVRGAIGKVPITPVFGLILTLVMLPKLPVQVSLIGIGLIAIGMLIYFLTPNHNVHLR